MCCCSGDGIYMHYQNLAWEWQPAYFWHTFANVWSQPLCYWKWSLLTVHSKWSCEVLCVHPKGPQVLKGWEKTEMVQPLYLRKEEMGARSRKRPTRSHRDCCLNKVTFRLLKRSKACALQVLKGHWETYLLRKPWFKLVDDLGGKVHFPHDIAALFPEEAKSVKGSTGLGTGCITQAWGEGNGFRLTGGLCPGLSGQPRWVSQTSNCALKANLPSPPKLKAGSHLLAASVR